MPCKFFALLTHRLPNFVGIPDEALECSASMRRQIGHPVSINHDDLVLTENSFPGVVNPKVVNQFNNHD
jgi:hypothetical protein